MAIKITCISKDNGDHENPYVAITQLGWVNEETDKTGTTSRVDMYNWIVDEGGYAYVRDSAGNSAKLIGVISPKGNKYVKTVADELKSDNLLKLPEC